MSIARLDIEATGRNKFSFKYWRAGDSQDIQHPYCRESLHLDRKDYYCNQMAQEIKLANQASPDFLDSGSKEKLINSGKILYNSLLPASIQKELKKLTHPILISMNDTTIPWELLHDGDDFLCVKHRISRDLHRTYHTTAAMTNFSSISAHAPEQIQFFFIVNPFDPEHELDDTFDECDTIVQSLDAANVSSTYLSGEQATLWDIKNEIASGYDVIHYVGHIQYDKKQKRGYIQLPENLKFFPEDVGYIQGHPLVFLNGCESDVKSRSKTKTEFYENGISLAQAFLLKGAKGVVGTIVKVPSSQAKTFACAFFECLLTGESISESMRLARLETREKFPNDAAFLSFVLYGYPEVTLVKLPSAADLAFFREDGSVDKAKFTSDLLKLLESAVSQAETLGSDKVEAEHLLLALLASKK